MSKPCPFCGTVPPSEDSIDGDILMNGMHFWVTCQKCGATGPQHKPGKGEAWDIGPFQKWNERKEQPIAGLVEVTEEDLE